MAVARITERFSEMRGSQSTTDRTATRSFDIEVNDPVNDTPTALLSSTIVDPSTGLLFPLRGDPFPTDLGLIAVSPRIDVIAPTLRRGIVEYRTSQLDEGGFNQPINPLDLPAQLEWSSKIESVEIDHDITSAPITNVNGEPFDPPISKDIGAPVLTVTQNVPDFQAQFIVSFINKVNSDSFLGAPAGTARVVGIGASLVTGESPFPMWRQTVTIEFRFNVATGVALADAWKARILERGFMESDGTGAGKNLRHIVDKEGSPIVEPKLLAADGTVLPLTSTEVFTLFQLYNSVPFTAMGLRI